MTLHAGPKTGQLCHGNFVDSGQHFITWMSASTESPPPVGTPIYKKLVCPLCGAAMAGPFVGTVQPSQEPVS